MERSSDRRKFKRFFVDNGALAVLKLDPIRLGRVVDISTDGLGIEYFNEKAWPEKRFTLSVLTQADASGLEDLPVRTVEDKVASENFVLEKFEKRCCCMQFCQLNAEQRSQVEAFIDSLTDRRS